MSRLIWTLFVLPIMVSQIHHAEESVKNVPHYPNGNTVYKTGRATYYSSGLMEHVARIRRIKLDGATGFSTYPDCSKIGGVLVVSVLNPHTQRWSAWARKRIVDCSETRDYARHVAEGLVELSYEQALDYGYLSEGHTRIRFYLEEPVTHDQGKAPK